MLGLSHERRKGTAPLYSLHTKLITHGIVTFCSTRAIKKQCSPTVRDSFDRQCTRLKNSGYWTHLASVTDSAAKVKNTNSPEKSKERPVKRPNVTNYIHRVSHWLKKVGTKYNIPDLFSAPLKDCKTANQKKKDFECGTWHRCKFVNCTESIAYKIPLTCGRSHVSQSGRCLNDRLREHHNACAPLAVNENLALQVNGCVKGCSPDFERATILFCSKHKITHEVLEAFAMLSRAEGDCISATSKGF